MSFTIREDVLLWAAYGVSVFLAFCVTARRMFRYEQTVWYPATAAFYRTEDANFAIFIGVICAGLGPVVLIFFWIVLPILHALRLLCDHTLFRE